MTASVMTHDEVTALIKELLVKELDTRIKLAKTRLPGMCTHNYLHTLDVRKKVEDETNDVYNRITRGPHLPVVQKIGLCMLGSDSPENWGGTICEDPIDAQRCPYFTPKMTKANIWEIFTSQIQDPKWLEEHMPVVYALMRLRKDFTISLPWWKKLWYAWFTDIHLEPQLLPLDINELLPPPQ